jgi:hypothetical protein
VFGKFVNHRHARGRNQHPFHYAATKVHAHFDLILDLEGAGDNESNAALRPAQVEIDAPLIDGSGGQIHLSAVIDWRHADSVLKG